MKIAVSVFGRFSIFDIAAQLEKHGMLNQLITSYPKFKVLEWGIPKNKITSYILLEIANRLDSILFNNKILNNWLKKLYGKWSIKKINEDINIYIFFAGNGYNSKIIKKLKSKGTVCIAVEGSAHVESLMKLLQEEDKLLGTSLYKMPNVELIDETKKEYELADYILVPSEFVLKSFITNGIKESKLIKIPYGVNTREFKKTNKNDNLFRVVFAGGLTYQKGVHYLIQAFAELDLPSSELWLIGDDGAQIAQCIQKYNNKKIKIKGRQPQDKLNWFYSQCSIYCQMSIQDGFGRVIPQAMSCGLPIICSKNTGGADLIQNGVNGFIIPIRDVNKLKEKILWMYNNPKKLIEMGKSASMKISDNYTWDEYGNSLIKIINDIICPVKNTYN